ncbi:hypothetical protein SARC_06484 [Sphaeroforma arctica JP610]|uniref:Uncharacterized protein n=1 Tax=Sphaeroforma arctica JP610 TaxID=667725 RepID=A0A0L0FYZ3_9EUKA|nr:hypothetical protein SARC_06484 [Sphaeroforma arctica JP610]KNC81173.1 hypothetical protein SARC_06484 [Sphaeroforma arctica JP610]|eukprot:XP_014155075.1 hypothetical protein SARC_06484 [Sphaeroforma arctica JP610]
MINDFINRSETGDKYSGEIEYENIQRLPRLGGSSPSSGRRHYNDLVNHNENGAKYSMGETDERMCRLPRLPSRQQAYVVDTNVIDSGADEQCHWS